MQLFRVSFPEELLPSVHSAWEPSFGAGLQQLLAETFSISTQHLWSSFRVNARFLATFLTKIPSPTVELVQTAVGRVLDDQRFFQMIMMESAELLGTVMGADFTQALSRSVACYSSVSQHFGSFALISIPSSQALFRQVCALQIKSNLFNTTLMNSDNDEPSQSWPKEMEKPWMTYMSVAAKSVNSNILVILQECWQEPVQ